MGKRRKFEINDYVILVSYGKDYYIKIAIFNQSTNLIIC